MPNNTPPPPHSPPEHDYIQVTEKVRSGEYFNEAKNMYDLSVHDPMAERYLYLSVTLMALLAFLIAFLASRELYPLKVEVPFLVTTNNIVEDLPRIRPLLSGRDDTPDEAVLRFLAQNYVVLREEYDINTLDRDTNGIKSQSSPEVFSEYQQMTDPHNPESPITLYQRHSERKIYILSSRRLAGDRIEVTYEAHVNGEGEIKKSQWVADIAFKYSGIQVDEKGNPKSVEFTVTQYRAKRIRDMNTEVIQSIQ